MTFWEGRMLVRAVMSRSVDNLVWLYFRCLLETQYEENYFILLCTDDSLTSLINTSRNDDCFIPVHHRTTVLGQILALPRRVTLGGVHDA